VSLASRELCDIGDDPYLYWQWDSGDPRLLRHVASSRCLTSPWPERDIRALGQGSVSAQWCSSSDKRQVRRPKGFCGARCPNCVNCSVFLPFLQSLFAEGEYGFISLFFLKKQQQNRSEISQFLFLYFNKLDLSTLNKPSKNYTCFILRRKQNYTYFCYEKSYTCFILKLYVFYFDKKLHMFYITCIVFRRLFSVDVTVTSIPILCSKLVFSCSKT